MTAAAARLPASVVGPISVIPVLMALAVVAVGLLRAARAGTGAGPQFAAALALGLEFFPAAGLLKLGSAQDLRTLGLVALIVALRKVASTGVRLAVRAVRGARVPTLRA